MVVGGKGKQTIDTVHVNNAELVCKELTSALLSFPLNRTESIIEADPKTLQN